MGCTVERDVSRPMSFPCCNTFKIQHVEGTMGLVLKHGGFRGENFMRIRSYHKESYHIWLSIYVLVL